MPVDSLTATLNEAIETWRDEGRREILREIAARGVEQMLVVERGPLFGRRFACQLCGGTYSTHRPDSPELEQELSRHHETDCMVLRAQQAAQEPGL